MKYKDIKKHLIEHKKVIQLIYKDKNFHKTIEELIELIKLTVLKNNKLMLAGNGGSAADAQHIAAEFIGKLNLKRKALPAIALNTDTSILTSISNDYNFDQIISRQIEGIGKEDDIFIGITTSGKSKNILRAIRSAKNRNIKVVTLTGKKGINLKKISDLCIIVPSKNTQIIQEIHITILHIICEMVEKSIK
jgi:D-sedoheptulose 7-phosphate isomerase